MQLWSVAFSNMFIAEYCFVILVCLHPSINTSSESPGKDIEGTKKLIVALSEIKGIGYNFAQVLTQSLTINPNMCVGSSTQNDIREIEQAISNPAG